MTFEVLIYLSNGGGVGGDCDLVAHVADGRVVPGIQGGVNTPGGEERGQHSQRES